jgi:hypothetical protein
MFEYVLVCVIIIVIYYLWIGNYNRANYGSPTIAIVGAGPAGITAALELIDAGVVPNTIMIYGDFGNCQVQERIVDDVRFNVGAIGISEMTGAPRFLYDLARRFLGSNAFIDSTDANVEYSGYRHENELNGEEVAQVSGLPQWKRIQDATSCHLFDKLAYTKKILAMESFGYGPITSLPLHKSMSLVRHQSAGRYSYKYIKGGMRNLFRIVKEYLESQGVVFVKKYVSAINPGCIVVDGRRIAADHIILACDPRRVASPVSHLLRGAVSHINYYSAVVSFKGGNVSPGVYNYILTENIRGNVPNMPVLVMIMPGPIGRTYGIVYGYCSDDVGRLAIGSVIGNEVYNRFNANDIKVHTLDKWEYNLHYNSAAVYNGIPEKVAQKNGVNNIWYSGGFFAQWDINSIIGHNKRLIELMQTMQTQLIPQ